MPIHYELGEDHVALITIDRPEVRNALDLYHFRDMANAWRRFRDDDLGPSVVGFGGDVPAFMLVRARPRRDASEQRMEEGEVEA